MLIESAISLLIKAFLINIAAIILTMSFNNHSIDAIKTGMMSYFVNDSTYIISADAEKIRLASNIINYASTIIISDAAIIIYASYIVSADAEKTRLASYIVNLCVYYHHIRRCYHHICVLYRSPQTLKRHDQRLISSTDASTIIILDAAFISGASIRAFYYNVIPFYQFPKV